MPTTPRPGRPLSSSPPDRHTGTAVTKIHGDRDILEYPGLRPYLEKLEGRKTQQTAATLKDIWGLSREETSKLASQLVEVGFFERRKTEEGDIYWVPFLYRDALRLVQGAEGVSADVPDEESVFDATEAAGSDAAVS